jgi:hypothetical protein
MADLVSSLRKEGYDYIDGAARNQKILSVWDKRDLKPISIFEATVADFYSSPYVMAAPVPAAALFVNYSKTKSYKVDLGIDVLKDLLKEANLGELGVKFKIEGSKTMEISWEKATTVDYTDAQVMKYFGTAGGKLVNPTAEIIEQANFDHLILITGVLYARNFQVHIKTTTKIDAGLAAEIEKIANGKMSVNTDNAKELVAKSDLAIEIPIAVKAVRLFFANGKYKRLAPITGNRWFFK